ncbi:MAG: hypothetical protein KAT25_02745 [Sulfuriflexus sp.]|nr:hypothetical protein [Sulfuriflexus sp.]
MNFVPKNIFTILLASSLLLANSFLAAGQNKIGVAAIAKDVLIVGQGVFRASDSINEGDELKIGANGNVTILFNDESMLMLGPNGHAKFDQYDETNNKPGRSIIRIIEGSFRYFPGNILAGGGSQFVAIGDKLLGQTADSQTQAPVDNHPIKQIIPSVRQKNRVSTLEVPAIGTGGLSLFASSGLTGHVLGDTSKFQGAVNIFSNEGSDLRLIGSSTALQATSLIFGQNSLPSGKELPIGNTPNHNLSDIGIPNVNIPTPDVPSASISHPSNNGKALGRNR